ncbi:hypothetical protein [Bradyrhizobium sp. 141]|uniref:hypothetical protein n=1 Tax=Bradyrhizobium sp. 141 TaxID=2782617 RepID=UPI001FFA0116|nr:hypothetical protein [Bradyrhizobium sp. 141]MCK1717558.1 hypothetical protein [Bradyrhizobium sp. 141]
MPVIQIRYNQQVVGETAIVAIAKNLPAVAANVLTCAESIILEPQHIMLEIDPARALDVNCKDINVRVWSHDFPGRRDRIDMIRNRIAKELLAHLPSGATWYVWILLAPTSYGSDTEEVRLSLARPN